MRTYAQLITKLYVWTPDGLVGDAPGQTSILVAQDSPEELIRGLRALAAEATYLAREVERENVPA